MFKVRLRASLCMHDIPKHCIHILGNNSIHFYLYSSFNNRHSHNTLKCIDLADTFIYSNLQSTNFEFKLTPFLLQAHHNYWDSSDRHVLRFCSEILKEISDLILNAWVVPCFSQTIYFWWCLKLQTVVLHSGSFRLVDCLITIINCCSFACTLDYQLCS